MSRNSERPGRGPVGANGRRKWSVRRDSLGRLFRSVGLDGSPIAPMIEALEGRALLSIGTPVAIGTSVPGTDPNSIDIINNVLNPIPANDTVIVTVVTPVIGATPPLQVSDTANNTYQLDKAESSATNLEVLIYSSYLANPVAALGGIQVTYTGTTLATPNLVMAASAIAVNGLVTPDVPDASGVGTGVSDGSGNPTTTTATATAATIQAAEIVVGAIGVAANTTITPGTIGATVATGAGEAASFDASKSILPEFQVVNATGTYSATASFSSATTEWAEALVTYKARPPVAAPETYHVNVGSTLADNLVNLSSFYGTNASKTAAVVAGPSEANSFTLQPDGTLSYTPSATATGTDSFQYTVSDGTQTSATATVTIDLTNTAPTVTDATDATATPGAFAIREDKNSGLITIASAASGPPPAFYEITTSSIQGWNLYLSDGTTPVSFTQQGGTYVAFVTASQATSGLIANASTGSFAFNVADATTNSSTTAVVGASTPVSFAVAPPQAPSVSATLTRENPVVGSTQQSSTIGISSPMGDNNYVLYYKITIPASNTSGILNGTLSDGTNTYSASAGSDYIPVADASNLTFTPNPGYFNTSATELFDVSAATTNSDATAALSTPSAVDISVAPPAMVQAADTDTSIRSNGSTTVTLTVGNGDAGYVRYFKLTSVLNGTVTLGGTTYDPSTNPYIPLGVGGTASVTFMPTAQLSGGSSTFGFVGQGATINAANAALSPSSTTFNIGVSGPAPVTVATVPANTSFIRENESIPLTLSIGTGDSPTYVKYFKILSTTGGTLTYNGSAVTYVPVGSGGTASVTFTPTTGQSGAAPMFGFTVVGATANDGTEAVSSPPTAFNLQVVAPEAPSVVNAASIDENTAATPTNASITLTVGQTPYNDSGYVNEFKLTSPVVGGTLTSADGTITYNQGSLIPVGAGGSTTLVFTPTPNTFTGATSFTFVAAATGTPVGNVEADSTPVTANLNVVPVSDLGLKFTPITTTETPNTPFTYTATVTNYGPSQATGVVLTDTFPVAATVPSTASVTVYQSGGAVVSTNPSVAVTHVSGTTYTIAIPNLPSGDYAVVTTTVTPTASSFGTALLNVAGVAHDATEHEPAVDPDPNSASVAVQIAGNLVVTSTTDDITQSGTLPFILNELAGLAPPPAGQPIPITFTVTQPIVLTTGLPTITRFVTIFGGTPTGPVTINATGLAGTGSVLTFGAGSDGATVQSVDILASSTATAAIEVDAGSTSPIQIFNDILIGTGPTSNPAGVLIKGANAEAIIAQGTQVTGFSTGISIVGSSGNVIQSDIIGTLDPSPSSPPNGIGVSVDAASTGNVIGASPMPMGTSGNYSYDYTTDQNLGNIIANNTVAGVKIAGAASATNNSVRGNSIYQNGPAGNGPGIADADPLSQSVITTLQGASLFGSATDEKLTVNFQLSLTNPSLVGASTFLAVIDFYSQAVSNPNASDLTQLVPYPEGRVFLGSEVVPIVAGTSAYSPPAFTLNSALATLVQADQFITATATLVRPASAGSPTDVGDTSGFSAPVIISNGLIVTTAMDDGTDLAGSLRAAIDNADSLTVPTTIFFNLPKLANGAPNVITLTGTLPTIDSNVTIDASPSGELQMGATVEIDGSHLASLSPELIIGGGNVTIRGLIFVDNAGPAIQVDATSSAVSLEIAGNTINGPSVGGFAEILVDESSAYATNVTIGGTGNANTITGILSAATAGMTLGAAIDVEPPSSGATLPGSTLSILNNTINLTGSSSTVAGYGIFVDGVSNVTIRNNAITGAGLAVAYGIDVEKAPSTTLGVTIRGNSISAATGSVVSFHDGIVVDDDATTTVTSNSVSGASYAGIFVSDGSVGTSLTSNSVAGAGASALYGIALQGASTSGTSITGGSISGSGSLGLFVSGAVGSSISGVSITGNAAGVLVLGVAGSALLGTSISGGTISGNTTFGVDLKDSSYVTIGGLVASAGNVIFGDGLDGVLIQQDSSFGVTSAHDVVAFNIIGIDAFGNTGVGAQSIGIHAIGLTNPVASGNVLANNVVSNNGQYGIDLDGSSGVTLAGNKIGTNAAGTSAAANGMVGVLVDGRSGLASGNTIGGVTQAAANVVSGNGSVGIEVVGLGATAETIEGNDVGTDILGSHGLGGQSVGVLVMDAPGSTIGGSVAGSGNVVSGNIQYGFELIDSFGLALQGNKIGTNAAGTGSIPNGIAGSATDAGIYITGTGTGPSLGTVTIGGTVASAGDLISGNGSTGILVMGTSATPLVIVEGDEIGTDVSGQTSLGTQMYGVSFQGVSGGTIGGTAAGAGNLISGNLQYGVFLNGDSGVVVEGNLIGTNSVGTVAVANGIAGVEVGGANAGSTPVTIGGPGAGGNTISGNAAGVYLAGIGAAGTVVEGNIIGGIATGSLGNQGDGIDLQGVSGATIVLNTIGANLGNGITAIGASGGVISANQIIINNQNGLDIKGKVAGLVLQANMVLTNKLNGVLIEQVAPPTSGYSVALGGNTFLDNGQDGIQLSAASGVDSTPLDPNRVDSNRNDGIELAAGSSLDLFWGDTVASNLTNGVEVDQGSHADSLLGLSISGNASDGIQIHQGSSSNVISGGTVSNNTGDGISIQDGNANVVAGATVDANAGNGILIGGTSSGNTLSSNIADNNDNDGVSILNAGFSNSLSGNTIEANETFGLAIASTGASSVVDNVIAFNNSNGIVIAGVVPGLSGSTLLGNAIVGNNLDGLLIIDGARETIGSAARPNVIDMNKSDGIGLFDSSNNLITGNVIGTDLGDRAGLGNLGDGVHIVGSTSAGSTGNDVQSNLISANHQSGVEIFGNSSSNFLLGNTLGTVSADAADLGNKLNGVLIAGTPGAVGSSIPNLADSPHDNYIGETYAGPATANDIAGNQSNGVVITLAADNHVQQDIIALNAIDGISLSEGSSGNEADGDTIVSNAADGVGLNDASNSLILLSVISFNADNGISLASSANDTTIRSDTIQANRAGDGINQGTSDGSIIQGNAIRYNAADGIGLTTANFSTVQGNAIQDNGADGIRLRLGSTSDDIGAAGAGANTITNNASAGVEVSTTSTADLIQGNVIGFSYAGTGNFSQPIGVYLNQVGGVTVGGISLGNGANTITGDGTYGIFVNGNDPTRPTVGNTIVSNFIGTSTVGTAPARFAPLTNADVGVYVLNSAKNAIDDNVVSGNHAAGVELFGQQSTGNVLDLNIIGPDGLLDAPILTDPTTSTVTYSAENRQQNGILINGAPSNTVGVGNAILGNYEGIQVEGSTATGNAIDSSVIGPDTPVSSSSGLGNLDGIYIANAANTTIVGDQVSRNIQTGISLVGTTADNNVVQGNFINANGAFGTANNGIYTVEIDPIDATGDQADGEAIFIGTGVYIEGGSNNVIGWNFQTTGTNPNPLSVEKNTITNNTVAGVYVYNFGVSSTNFNSIAGNTIVGADAATNPKPSAYYYIGQYGVLLFDSSGNIAGVPQFGAYENNITGTTFAPFREYTGPGPLQVLVVPDSAASPAVKAASLAPVAEAADATPAVVKATGKAHPRPPAIKHQSRKS